MSRLTMKMKLALGIAGALLASSNASAQEYFDSYTGYEPAYNYDYAAPVETAAAAEDDGPWTCLLYTSPSPRD